MISMGRARPESADSCIQCAFDTVDFRCCADSSQVAGRSPSSSRAIHRVADSTAAFSALFLSVVTVSTVEYSIDRLQPSQMMLKEAAE